MLKQLFVLQFINKNVLKAVTGLLPRGVKGDLLK